MNIEKVFVDVIRDTLDTLERNSGLCQQLIRSCGYNNHVVHFICIVIVTKNLIHKL